MPEVMHTLCFKKMQCCTDIFKTVQYKLAFCQFFIFSFCDAVVGKADLAASCKLIYEVRDRERD